MPNLKKNLVLQTVYQVLNTCLPLITAPYLARVLGASQLGLSSYTSSVVAYFTLIAMLGTVNYGTRAIAMTYNDRAERSRLFWEIYSLQLFFSLAATIAYCAYLLVAPLDNHFISVLQIISLFACIFDISWLFFGVEDFTTTVLRSIIVKVTTVMLILIFVRTSSDLYIYIIIMLGGTLISNIVLWFRLKAHVDYVHVKTTDIFSHLKPNFSLFIPLFAMSVYHIMDKTMLGILSSYDQCGFYYNSDKVINIPLCIITGIGTVMLPRMTSLISSGKMEKANQTFLVSLEGIIALTVAMSFGIAAVSPDFIPIFFGPGYEPCVTLTVVFAPILLIKSASSIIRTQYLIPYKMETSFTKSVIFGAVVNIAANLIFIPRYHALGAVIGTLLAELAACAYQFYEIRTSVNVYLCLKRCSVYVLIGCTMFVIVRILCRHISSIWISLIFGVFVGSIFFSAVCFLFWRKTNSILFEVFLPINKGKL